MLAVARPCLQQGLARTDAVVLEAIYEFLDLCDKCTELMGEGLARDREATFNLCLRSQTLNSSGAKEEDVKAVCFI